MTDLGTLCTEFGIDEAAAEKALADTHGEKGSPWYVRGFLALGAWVTAMAIIAFFAVLLMLNGGDDPEYALMLWGAVAFAAGILMLAKDIGGEFWTSFATALAAAGAAMVTAGVGIATENLWVSVFFGFVLAGIVVGWASNFILQLLASGLAVGLVAGALVVEEVPYFLDIAALLLVPGVLLWARPPRIDMRPTAFALLLAEPALSIFVRFEFWSHIPIGGWFAQAVHIALFVWLVSILWRRLAGQDDRMKLAVFAAAAVMVGLVMPVGGSGALVIMTLAFVLGSRPLALLGVLLQAFFFWQFYYDLAISLLNKSLLLTAAGLVILACWWLVTRRGTEGAGA